MFFVSPIFSAVSILLCLSLVLGLNFFSPIQHKNWGSISQALLFHQVDLTIPAKATKHFFYIVCIVRLYTISTAFLRRSAIGHHTNKSSLSIHILWCYHLN